MKLLNLGCGQKYHKDWINIDFVSNNEHVLSHNLLRGIPLNDDSVEVVYHSHVLEHFSKSDGLKFMKECFRVLKPNGIIRIAVPDLETIAREYLRNLELADVGNKEAKDNYEWIKLELLDQMVRNESGGLMKEYLCQSILPNEKYVYSRIGAEGKSIRRNSLKNLDVIIPKEKIKPVKYSLLEGILSTLKKKLLKSSKKSIRSFSTEQKEALRIGQFRLKGENHQWMYDRYSLTELLRKIGFKEIILCTAFKSQIKNWERYQLDTVDGEIRKPDSLFIEAKK